MKLRTSIILGIAIIAATAGGIALMAPAGEEARPTAQKEQVWNARTISTEIGAWRPQIKLIGQLESTRDVTEIAQLSASVVNVNFQDGMRVKQGEVIVQLDDFDARQQLQQIEADLSELASRLNLQESQFQLNKEALNVERAQLSLLEDRLNSQKAVRNTPQTIADLEQEIRRQRFSVSQREAAINNHPFDMKQLEIQRTKLELSKASAARALANTQVVAPFSGRLAQVTVQEGQYVNAGQPLFRLYAEDEIAASALLPISLLADVTKLDGRVEDQQRQSNVSFARNEAFVNAGQSGFKAWFQLDDATQWLPGDVAYLTLNLTAQPQTLKVPSAAVFQDRWLYRVDADQRLEAIGIQILGTVTENENTLLVVQTDTQTEPELRLLVTRLNNPTTGMKIYEEGVDPEPVVEQEDDQSESEVADENV